MGTICLSLTKQIRDIAEELHENPQVILAKVQAYMTEKNTTIIPTITQLKLDGYLDRKVETLSNDYNEEQNEILKNAKRDEQGRLLAPNGKVSNLNEKQYVQVRTKAFKKWFGDWEVVNTFRTDLDSSRVEFEITSNKDEHQGNQTLKIYLKGQKDKGHFELVKDREFGQYSVHFKTDKTKLQPGDTKILFEELSKAIPNGAIVSTWGSLSEDGIRALPNIGRGMQKIGERTATRKSDGSSINIPVYQKGEGVSKVIDENGEPLVVYHTRDAFKENFDTFDTKIEGRPTAIYATNDRKMSSSYWKFGKNRDDFGEFSWFVTTINEDIKKEMFDPFTGEKLESINPEYTRLLKLLSKLGFKYNTDKEIFTIEELKQIRDTIKEKYELEDLKKLFFNIKNPVIVEGNDANWDNILFNGKRMSTRDIEEYFRTSNHDGIIFKNIKDYGGYDNLGTSANVYAAYSSNQVKSATDNIGTFDANNDNILYNIINQKYPKNALVNILNYNEEYNEILRNAKRDLKGRLLAPNGKVSNLNERQYAQVRTKEFKDWFGDWENDPKNASKVVDENGEPLVVYHTVRNVHADEITSFVEQTGFKHNKFFYFSNDKATSQTYFEGKPTIGNKEDRNEVLKKAKDKINNKEEAKNINSFKELIAYLNNLKTNLTNELNKLSSKKTSLVGKFDFNTGNYVKNEENTEVKEKIDNIKYKIDNIDNLIYNYSIYARVEEKNADSILDLNTYPVFLNIRTNNSVELNANGKNWHDYNMQDIGSQFDYNPEIYAESKKSGINGFIIKNYKDSKSESDPNIGLSTTYAVKNSNQIKSAESNVGTFDVNDDNILKFISTPLEYKDFLDEMSLNLDKADTFIYNFMTKIINVNPRYKALKTGATPRKFYFNKTTKLPEELITKIFGIPAYEVIKNSQSRESLEKDLDIFLDNWYNILSENLNKYNDKVTKAYSDIDKQQKIIQLLQRYSNNNLDRNLFSEEELSTIDSLLNNVKDKNSRKSVGYVIQKLKQILEQLQDTAKKLSFIYNAKKISFKNRILAFNLIPNLKELIKQRILAEYDAYTIKDKDYDLLVKPHEKLFYALLEAMTSSNRELSEQQLLGKPGEMSYDELTNYILSKNKEYKTLLDLIHAANPNLKIEILDTTYNDKYSYSVTLDGTVVGWFRPSENKVYLHSNTDIQTIIHELTHAGTYYGLVGKTEESKPFTEQVNKFMQYIRDYIKTVTQEEKLLDPITVFGTKMPANIYGFTNASEFVAETFGNPKFQQFLDLIPAMEPKKFNSLLEQFVDTIVNFFKKIFGKQVKETALTQAKKLALTAMRLQTENINEVYQLLSKFTSESQKNVVNNTKEERPQHQVEQVNENEIPLHSIANAQTNEALRKLSMDFTPFEIEARSKNVANWIQGAAQELAIAYRDDILEQIENSNDEIEKEKLRKKIDAEDEDVETLTAFLLSKGYISFNDVLTKAKQNIEQYKSWIDDDLSDEEKLHQEEQYDKVLDNFETLVTQSLQQIEEALEVKISLSDVNSESYEESDAIEEDEDEERVAEGNSGWAFKIRMKDAHETLSLKVKRFLRSIQKVNRVDGEYEEEYDDLGYPVYVNEGYAYSVIQTYLSDMDSPEDFHYVDEKGEHHFPALEGMIERYPFVNELITMLKIKADVDPTIIPLFYSGFRNDYINYYTMVDGKFLQANRTEGAEIAYNAVLNDYENGIATPLTIWDNKRTLLKEKVEKANILFNSLKSAMSDNMGDIALGDKHIDRNKLIQGKAQFKMLYDLLESIGINAENLESYLTPTESNKFYVEQSTEKILNSISEILAGADRYVKNNNADVSFVSDYQSRYRDIAGIVGETSKFARAMTFRQGKGKDAKDYASYSAPNYINTLFKRLLNTNPEKRKIVLDLYKKDPRFYFGGVWKNKILEFFDKVDTDTNTQRALDDYRLTCLINVNYLDDETYENWTPASIAKNFIHIYYSIPEKPGAKTQYGYYHFPIFADSPCAMFMKFERIPLILSGGEANKKQGRIDFEEKIIDLMESLVYSELCRFALIDKRALDKTLEKIANFDKNGKNFFYFLEMNNDEKFKSDLNDLIQQRNEFKSKNMTNSLQDANNKIRKLIREKLKQSIRIEFEQYKKEIEPYRNEIMFELSREGITFSNFELDELEKIREMELKKIPLGESEKNLKNKIVRFSNQDDALMEYFYNSELMTGNIIQMTAVDPAFFRFDGGIDFQKRYKQIYASGQRLDTTSKYGRKIEKTIYLKDYHQASMILNTIKDTFQKAVDEHKITKEEYLFIVDSYADINVTDAQAYRSLSSMRAVLDMAGKWTDKFDESFNRIQNGEWTYDDFLVVWSTLKPFVFSITSKQVTKDSKDGEMLVPHQNKNSEFLLMAMYDLFAGATRNSATMRGLSRFMEDFLIDVAQYDSAVKCGGQGIIDINYSVDTIKKILDGSIKSIDGINNKRFKEIVDAINNLKDNKDVVDKLTENALELLEKGEITQDEYNSLMQAIQPTEEEVYNTLLNACFVKNSEGKLTNTMNDNVVHTLNYEDYMFAQPTQPHLKDLLAVDGSLTRNLIIADISEDATFEIDGKIYHKKDIIDAYNNLYIANLCEDYVDTYEQVANKQKLSEFLVRQVTGNPKYSKDMQNVLRLNKDGEFTIPLDFPSVSVKIQDLMLSKFKNGVTKQKTKGAACILASCVGLSHSLKIVLSDGSTLNASDKNAVKNAIDNNLIKGAECYLPASSRKFFEDFLVTKTTKTKDKKGNIVERTYQELDIEKMPKELRECVGYRIPTENKCSMMPLIIKGFLPETNDGTIMLPADITVIAGSDFDVDKMFLMFYEYNRIKYDKDKAYKDFIELKKSLSGLTYLNSEEAKKLAEALGIEMDIEDNEELPETFKEFFKQNKEKYKLAKPRYEKVKYNHKKTYLYNNRAARNNYLLDIRLSILKNKDSALNFFNPSNFESLKKDTDVVMIVRDHKLLKQYMLDKGIKPGHFLEAYKSLNNESLKYLKNFLAKYKEKNPLLSPITFMRNHNQNMTGGKLVGIYANNTSMQTKYQTSDLALKDNYAFYFNGVKFKSLHDIKTVRNGVEYYISKNCGYFQAASVDNVKDPVVANLMQNEKTAHITGFMLRLGMLPSEIALFFSQDEVMYNIITRGEISAKSLTLIIDRQIEYYKKNYGIKVNLETKPDYNYTSEELAESIALKNELRETISGTLNEQEKQERIKLFGEENLLKTANTEIMYLKKFLDIVNLAELLRPSINISIADSPNGAIDITLAGANAQLIAVEKWLKKTKKIDFPFIGADKIVNNNLSKKNGQTRPDLSKEELFKILSSDENKVKRLQAFYTLGIDNGVKAFKHYFLSQSDAAQRVSKELRDSIDGDYNTEPLLQNLYKSLITWLLSKTKLFGDDERMTYEQKRDYYLYKFPDLFIKFRDSHPDLFFSGVLSLLQVKNGRIQIERSGRITPTVRETLQNSFDLLMYSTDPEVINFAQDLFIYSYYLDSFYFGPNSYGAFFSSNFLLNFTEILDTLRNVNPNYNELSDIEDVFAVQNHSLWRQYEVEQDNKKLIISGDKAYVTEYKPKKYITINSEKNLTTDVYKLVSSSDYFFDEDEKFLLDKSQDNKKKTYKYQKLNNIYSPFGDLYNGNKKLEDYNYPKTEEAEKRYLNLKLLNSASLHTRRYQKQIITQQSNTQQTTTANAVLGLNENESNFDSMVSSVDEQLEYGVGVNEFKTENDLVDAMLELQRLKDLKIQEMGEKWMEEHSSLFNDVDLQEANLKYDTEESQKVQTDNGGERLC